MTPWKRSYLSLLKTVAAVDLELDRVADERFAAATLHESTTGWDAKLQFLRSLRTNLQTTELIPQ